MKQETAEFEEQKELELSELLLMQQKFAGEFEKSQVQINSSQSIVVVINLLTTFSYNYSLLYNRVLKI